MFSSEESIEPFWAEYSGEASGRDPLAIQNSSVVIYSKMIIGITNVTNRIRYNGFFCWIFDTIARNIDKPNSLTEQIRHSRRAELLLAFVMVKNFKEITGVSGSIFATNHIKQRIFLKNGADWEYKKEDGPGLYWKNKYGIFGQYFSGVMRDLNLINHPQGELNIYTLTSNGNELAIAFGKSINKKERELFWKCVFTGVVTESELNMLPSFALHIIPDGSDEQRIYRNLMTSQDDKKITPTYNRKNSIKLILNHLVNLRQIKDNLTNSFLQENYLQNITRGELKFDTSTSWYLYEINELLHVAYEHFHTCFLNVITTQPTLLDSSIKELVELTVSSFKEEKINAKTLKLENLINIILKQKPSSYDYYYAMLTSFAKNDFGSTLKNSIYTITNIYIENKHHLADLDSFTTSAENNFNRNGYALELIDELVLKRIGLTISEYIKSVMLFAINLHMFSSYGKSKIGQSLVHNYMIEGPLVWKLRETAPRRTTPRLQNAIQYMIDLGWVGRKDKDYSITESGVNVLQSL